MNQAQKTFQASAKLFVENRQYEFAAVHYKLAADVSDEERDRQILKRLSARYDSLSRRQL